ncbi:MAG: hypothetical protein J0I26_07220 [Alphaproteobacteria bacterium]|nr:hypothetical protein [Alphaproteobacteria bacterium]
MLNLAEYRNKAARLADFLPWAALAAEGVVLNKDGSFQRTARFRGPDLDSATSAELVGATARLNNALRRLGSGWAIFVEAQRHPATAYPDSRFPDPVSALVDHERRAQFEEESAHFENTYFLTLLWLPPAEDATRAEGWLYEGRSQKGVDPKELLRGFVDRTDRVLQLVEGFIPEVAWLDDAETLTYLHSTVSTRRQRVRVPETPMYLDALLADEPLTGGLEPQLGHHHLRTLTVVGFPTMTHPGILDELNRLAFPYRWMTRAICLDKTDATKLITRIRRQWFAKRKSIAAIVKEVMTNEASVLLDSDAANKAADADLALQELGADHAGEAYVTATVSVWDEDAGVAAEKLRLVEKITRPVEPAVVAAPGSASVEPPAPGQTASSDPTATQNMQNQKLAFMNGPVDRRTVSLDRLEAPPSPYVVQAGAVIPAALITGIRSDLPGQVTAQVTEDVYDSPTGRYLLIPQGARLIGQYDSQISFAQSRVQLVWTRLILPNGKSIVLERQPGADAEGYAGLEDEVDNHWGMLFKAALLSTMLSVGAEAGTSDSANNLAQAIRMGASSSISQTGQQIVERNLNVQPTLSIRPGFPVRVLVDRDLVLAPYR